MKPINTPKTTLTILLLLTQLLPILAQQNTFDLEINYNQTFEEFSEEVKKKVKEKLKKKSEQEKVKLEVNQETLYFFNKKARQVKPFSEFRQTYEKAQNLTLKEDEMNNITVFFPLKISQQNLNKVKKLKEETDKKEELDIIEGWFIGVLSNKRQLLKFYSQLNEVKKHLQPPKSEEKDDKLLQHELKVYTEFFKIAFIPGVNEIEGSWEDYKEFIKKEVKNRMENKETSFRKEVQKKIKEVAKKTKQEQKNKVNKQQSQLTRAEVNKKIKELKSKKDDKKNDPKVKQKLLEKKNKIMQLIQNKNQFLRQRTNEFVAVYYNYLIKTKTYTDMCLTISENFNQKIAQVQQHRRQVLHNQNHLLNRGRDPNHLPQNLLYNPNPNHQRNLNQDDNVDLALLEQEWVEHVKRESLKLDEILQEADLSEAIYNSLQGQKKPRNSNQDDSMITNPIAKESKNLSQDIDKKKVEQVKNDREDLAKASQKDKKAVASSSEDGGNSDGKSSQSLVITTLATLSLIAGGIGLMYLITQKNKKKLEQKEATSSQSGK